MDNPFAEGENRLIRPPSTAMIIFGATGDLTQRKLIPALYNLQLDGYLPPGFVVLGVARSELSDEEFRGRLFQSLKEHSRSVIDLALWETFSRHIFYQKLDLKDSSEYITLKKRLAKLASERGEDLNYLFYLATAPEFFGDIAANLKEVGMVEDPISGFKQTNIVVEKPFGNDKESARVLNQTLRNSFAESQIFRIDHYLGKETVQNILVFRFANGIFEPLWNHKYIDHIQISVCEDLGVGSRAGYFDKTGILKDIVQNHVFQILSLLCIEPPISLSDADSIRDEKVKVLKSIRPFSEEDISKNVVRANYTRGFINGVPVKAYHEEAGIASGSQTETYVAMKLEIDNWRWAGIPIYIRVGKRLPKRITQLTVNFRRPPDSLFRGRQVELRQNALSIQVQPREGITLGINSKPPGPRLRARPVNMDFAYGSSFGVASPEAYERLLLDAMKSDATLFTRDDEIEAAWDVLMPVINHWSGLSSSPTLSYEAGSWGPSEAATLLKPFGHRWERF
jgi:glucose-6-phosphate 1-dehydrogenase